MLQVSKKFGSICQSAVVYMNCAYFWSECFGGGVGSGGGVFVLGRRGHWCHWRKGVEIDWMRALFGVQG